MSSDVEELKKALESAEAEIARLRSALERKACSDEKTAVIDAETHGIRLTHVEGMEQKVLDSLPVRVFWKDTELNYLGCNRLFAQDAGLENPQQIIGKTDYELGWAKQAELYRADDRKVIDEGKTLRDYEEPQTTPQGATIWLKTTKLPLLDDAGNPVGVMGTYEDISVRKEAEAAMVQARDAAEQASRGKSEFLAMMSHEIRTPLNGILGLTQVLEIDETDDERLGMYKTIYKSGDTLLGIVSDILELAKIESGQYEITPREFDPLKHLQELVREHDSEISEKGIRFHIQADSTVPSRVVLDGSYWGQIASNLLSNAIKFTEKGEVVLRLHVRKPEASTEHGILELEVEDTGIGISDEQMKRLFKPFSQGDSSSTRKYGGTGLGLVLSRRIAQLLGGDVSCESVFGRGSRFYSEVKVRLETDFPQEAAPEVMHTSG